jgi:hypothetical protein
MNLMAIIAAANKQWQHYLYKDFQLMLLQKVVSVSRQSDASGTVAMLTK